MRLSASRLRTYQTCPRQYRYHYVDELPSVVTGPLVFGQTLHAALCHLHRRSLETGEPLDLADVLEAFDGFWRQALSEEEPVFTGDQDALGYEGLAGEILAGYVLANEGKSPPLALEFGFELPWEGHLLNGFIDRIDEAGGGLIVTDYKSGKRKPTPQALRDDVQLTLYAFVVGQLFEAPVDRIVYYHLRDQTALETHRDAGDYRRLEEEILRRVAAGIEAEQFPPRRGWWCRFCDYRATCEAEGPADLYLPDCPAAVCVPQGKEPNPWPT